MLYEDAAEIAEYVSQVMREAAKDSIVLLYASGANPFLEELIKNADRVFYFNERPRTEARIVARANPRTQKSQTTLEAFT